MSDLQMATLAFQRTEDGAQQVTFGGRGLPALATAAGFFAAGMVVAAIAIADCLRPAGDSPHARTPSSDRSPA